MGVGGTVDIRAYVGVMQPLRQLATQYAPQRRWGFWGKISQTQALARNDQQMGVPLLKAPRYKSQQRLEGLVLGHAMQVKGAIDVFGAP